MSDERGSPDSGALVELDMHELTEIEVGTLTGANKKIHPSLVTTITHEDIELSGARDLRELLEQFVPNLIYTLHEFEPPHLGIRGVSLDRENSYLLVVNGRVITELTHMGAITEHDFVTLGDIERIDFVRGPASAVYGLGALLGVLSITTFNGNTFQGIDVTVSAGARSEYQSAALRIGSRISDEVTSFFYLGAANQVGASPSDAPLVFPLDGTLTNGSPVEADEKVRAGVSAYQNPYKGRTPLKIHAELSGESWNMWTRFLRSGSTYNTAVPWAYQPPVGFDLPLTDFNQWDESGQGYTYWGAYGSKSIEISDELNLEFQLGYTLIDVDELIEFLNRYDYLNRETQTTAGFLARYTPSSEHTFASGFQYLHLETGLPNIGSPDTNSVFNRVNNTFDSNEFSRWDTDTFSVLGEYKWLPSEKVALFLSGRVDKNDYTDFLFSQRLAVAYSPFEEHRVRFSVSESKRVGFAEELRVEKVGKSRADGEHESLLSTEVGYGFYPDETSSFELTSFVNWYDLIAVGNAGGGTDNPRSVPVGELSMLGIEAEYAYTSKLLRLALSHSWSQMLHFDETEAGQSLTASTDGYGDDIINWSEHISKISLTWYPLEKVTVFSSLRLLWRFPGTADAARRDYERLNDPLFTDSAVSYVYATEPDYNPHDDLIARWNAGVSYQLGSNYSVQVNGYNLLGLLDDDLNQRPIQFSGIRRVEPYDFGVTLKVAL